MLKNYIKIGVRNLIKHRSYSLINICGLSLSLAVTILMLLWVFDEWNTDKFHEYGERLYWVKRTIPQENNTLDVYQSVPLPVVESAVKELPEVEKYITITNPFEESLQIGETVLRASGAYGNAAYFEAFSFPVIMGDISQLDKKVDAIAISESLAKRIFGNVWKSVSLSETIHIHNMGDFIVEAIFEDAPDQSSIKNEFIYSFGHYRKDNDWINEWTNSGMSGVILISEDADPLQVGDKIEQLYQKNIEGDIKEGIIMQPFSDRYLYGIFDDQAQVVGGRIEYVRTFAWSAFLLLLISCINFVNLATARASKRAKEVGVRKTIGAGKNSLIGQFMIEASVITSISILVAIVVALVSLPYVNRITEKSLSLDLTLPELWLGLTSIFIITTLLSGSYPSFVIAKFDPVGSLKSNVSKSIGNVSLRKGLVIVQFVLALLLIIGALVVQQQVEFIKNKNLGLNKDNLLTIHQDQDISDNYKVLKTKLQNKTGIKGVTTIGPSPINVQSSSSGMEWPGKQPDQRNIEFLILWAADNFADVLELDFVAGRPYREGGILDSVNIIVNEKALEVMGITDPIGKMVTWWGEPRQIIGVVKDFHNRSLYEKIKPLVFLLDPLDAGWLFIKAEDGQIPQAISGLKEAFAEVIPNVPLHYDFVDDQYRKVYKNEELTGTLAKYFALISILISCLGLLGLATFFAQQRNKEIGVRKVLGASVGNLIGLLSKEFILLVIIGLFIGVPIAWYFMTSWLSNFEYFIHLNVWMFIVPIFLIIAISVFTVGVQALRAATTDPLNSLRSE